MRAPTDILLLHDGDPVGTAVEAELSSRGLPFRQLAAGAPADQIIDTALGCRAIVAIGAVAAAPQVRAAAELPGVRALVLVVDGAVDLQPIKRSGAPYVVLRPAPLLEDFARALAPALARGKLVLTRGEEPRFAWVSAAEVARCVITAIDSDEMCGRVVPVTAPEPLPLGELAARVARSQGRALKVSRLPRWAVAPMRALGWIPGFPAREAQAKEEPTMEVKR